MNRSRIFDERTMEHLAMLRDEIQRNTPLSTIRSKTKKRNRKHIKRIHFLCPACRRDYKKRCEYFDAPRACPLCKVRAVPILMQARSHDLKSIATRRSFQPKTERRRKRELWESTKYSAYLNSEAWRAKRQKIIARDGGKCRTCTLSATHVHHITYENLGREPLEDLVLLCEACHKLEHELYTLRSRYQHWRKENLTLVA